MCGSVGTVGGGVCKLCGYRRKDPRDWSVVDSNGFNVEMALDERGAMERAYKKGYPYIRNEQTGKRLKVTFKPTMVKSECKQCRDARGRFTKKREVLSIMPMDEPNPMEIIRSSLPATTISC